jgi:hypothetical protein
VAQRQPGAIRQRDQLFDMDKLHLPAVAGRQPLRSQPDGRRNIAV